MLRSFSRTLCTAAFFTIAVFGVAHAGPQDNLDGFAWSSNIGWISFNCENTDCLDSNYGVDLAETQNGYRNFSGYAWSSNIGWISFNAGDVTGCPGGGECRARIDVGTNIAEGWAKALAGENDPSDGWDGWIKLSGDTTIGTQYGALFVDNDYFRGWSWAGENDTAGAPLGIIGWISWNCIDRGVCGASDYRVALKDVTITITKTGLGLVVSEEDPRQIDCGSDCVGDYAVDTVVTLTAYPDPGYAFDSWTNCSPADTSQCEAIADFDKEVHVTFTLVNLYTGVRFVDDPPGGGGVIIDGEGGSVTEVPHDINCSEGECGYTIPVNDQVDLTADSAPGYKFVQWFNPGGDTPCANQFTNPCSFVKSDSLETARVQFRKTQCNNGRDDDGDGLIDDLDPQCSSIDDDNEEENEGFSDNCPFDGPGACPACNDGIDNETPTGDGLIDYRGFCDGFPSATNESECNDANDPPDNPTQWYPADPGCSGSRYRTTEAGLNNRVKEY